LAARKQQASSSCVLSRIGAFDTMDRILPTNAAVAAKPLRLLHIEHDQADAELCLRALQQAGLDFQIEVVATPEELARKLRETAFDVALTDYRLPGWNGIDALAQIKQTGLDLPLILVTGTLGDGLAVECIKSGVTDYVLKDQLARLPMAIHRAQEEKLLRDAERRAVAALRESEEHYRTLVENAPEAIIVFDVDNRAFIDCNENALLLLRLTREELLRSNPDDVSAAVQFGGRSAGAAERDVVEQALSGETPCFEWMFHNSQGEEFPAEVHLVRLPSPTRRLIRGSILDITDRKRAEEALRESEARYRGLVNNATYGIYWVRIPEGDLLYVNPALVRMLGYESAEDLLRIRLTRELYRDPSAHEEQIAQYLATERVHATLDWKRKDGKIITVRISGRRAKYPDQNYDCAEVIVEDVSERTALEKQLVQAQKFEGIGQLAGGIAHDFNNMIGAILGWADLGMEETESGSRLHRHFEKVRHQAERAAALTRQLLAFARRQILEPRNIDMNKTVTETLSLLEKVIGSNIEIKTNLATDLAVVCADPTQVEQVLMNLCINARDAMPDGGSLIIETSNTSFDEKYCAAQPFARPGRYVMLSVSDTGTGMDSPTLDRIFEPFFTTKEMGKGTGLGLATVYGIARQHGGFVHVYSEVGLGSRFRVFLPFSATAAVAPERVEDTRPVRGGTETILVAEDHEGLREIARETLSNHGYQVLLAIDGEQAVQMFQSQRDQIDLVLLDVVLPKLSGPEAYSRICRENPEVPVIFATGYSPDIALLAKVQAQGLPVIQKPYSTRDLARKVRETLDRYSRLVRRD
jgi:two-component system cell cycle sensor histidine kinase/response regulator CckA